MEQFDEIEKLFKQLETVENKPIPEAHLNDLQQRLDNYALQHSAKGFNRISAFKAAAAVIIAASTIYFTYKQFSDSTTTALNTSSKSTSGNSSPDGIAASTYNSENSSGTVQQNTNNGNSDNQNNNFSSLSREHNGNETTPEGSDVNNNENLNTVKNNVAAGNSNYKTTDNNVNSSTNRPLKGNGTQNKPSASMAATTNSSSNNGNNNTNKSNNNANYIVKATSNQQNETNSWIEEDMINLPLFKLISGQNTTNQLLCEGEDIAEIKYIVSYKSVNPLIYLNLPKGLTYSYNNDVLIVKGTPDNIWGKQVVSIKAKANNIYDSVNFSITIIQKPKAKFSYSPQNGASPLNVKFSNQSKGSNSYFWDFGDGNQSTNENPTNTYDADGIYTVKLKVVANSDKSKCEDIATQNIIVGKHSIPNSFTPNGDGVNDLFIINPVLDLNFKAEIYSLQSEKVAELNNSNNSWNGNNISTNVKCPAGTYFYMVTFTDNKGTIIKIEKGSIQLFR